MQLYVIINEHLTIDLNMTMKITTITIYTLKRGMFKWQ